MILGNITQHVCERAIAVGRYILQTDATIRRAAAVFKVSKSTIHKDVRYRLPLIDVGLAHRVGGIIEAHKLRRCKAKNKSFHF